MYLSIYLFTCIRRQHLFTWFFVSLLMQTCIVFDVLGFMWKKHVFKLGDIGKTMTIFQTWTTNYTFWSGLWSGPFAAEGRGDWCCVNKSCYTTENQHNNGKQSVDDVYLLLQKGDVSLVCSFSGGVFPCPGKSSHHHCPKDDLFW